MPNDVTFLSVREYAEAHGLSDRTVRNTCLTAQDHYKELLTYFKIRFK